MDIFLVYVQFVDNITAITVLQVLKQCYRYQKKNLKQYFNFNGILFGLERNLFILKGCVDYFNEIFGWTTLFSYIFITCGTFSFIAHTIKISSSKITLSFSFEILLFLRILLSLIAWVDYYFRIIDKLKNSVLGYNRKFYFFCDQIFKEFEEILSFFVKIKSFVKKRDFTATRFYTIKKQMFFSILNVAITFLIVVIQFKFNYWNK